MGRRIERSCMCKSCHSDHFRIYLTHKSFSSLNETGLDLNERSTGHLMTVLARDAYYLIERKCAEISVPVTDLWVQILSRQKFGLLVNEYHGNVSNSNSECEFRITRHFPPLLK